MDEFNWQFCIFGSETEPYKTFMLETGWWFFSSEYEAAYSNRNLADLVLWGYINSSTLNEEDCILKLRSHFHVLLLFQYTGFACTSKCEGKTCSYTKWHRSTRSTLTCILNWGKPNIYMEKLEQLSFNNVKWGSFIIPSQIYRKRRQLWKTKSNAQKISLQTCLTLPTFY